MYSRYSTSSVGDFIALAIYFFGVTTCFTFSTLYVIIPHTMTSCSLLWLIALWCSFHTCMNHSKEVWKLGNELDHLGIVIVIWSSMVSVDYFGFYCDPKLQSIYCASVSSACITECGGVVILAGYTQCCHLRYLHNATSIPYAIISCHTITILRRTRPVGFRTSCARCTYQWLGAAESKDVYILLCRPRRPQWYWYNDLRHPSS